MPHPAQTLVQHALLDQRCIRMIDVQASYHVVAGSPLVPVFSALFPCCLFLFQPFLSLLPLPLPQSLYLHVSTIHSENFFCVSKFVSLVSFFYVALLVQLLMQVSATTTGLVAHLLLERESSPHRPILQPWGYLVGF